MATPVPQIILDSYAPATYIANDGFETDTSGWSVAAGINAAATSITRTTGDHYMGVASATLVTTATNGSGCKYVTADGFIGGTAYRFAVYLKSVSGTTSAKLTIGSLGTAGDRASQAITLTTSWAQYTVEWTPSADRTDVQVNITNGTASAMTCLIDDAEVFAVLNDVTGYASSFSFSRGANFEGGLAIGSCVIVLRNDDKRFTTGSAQIIIGSTAWIRATYAGVTYGLFFGTVTRVAMNAAERTVELFVTEVSDAWDTGIEVNIAASTTRTLSAFRGLILDEMGLTAGQRNLSTAEAEADMPWTGADQASAMNLLAAIDRSTRTLSFLVYDPSPSVKYVYTTVARMAWSTQAVAESLANAYTDMSLSVDFDQYINVQRVNMTGRALAPAADVWTSTEVPFTVPASTTRVIWASLPTPTLNQSLTAVSSGVTITFTPFSQSAKISIDGAGSVDSLIISGQAAVDQTTSATYDSAHLPVRTGTIIDAEYTPTTAAAAGLAEFTVKANDLAYESGQPFGTITLEQTFPTQLARTLGDKLTIDPAIVFSSYNVTLLGVATEVDQDAWKTTYTVGPPGMDPTLYATFFTLGTSTLGGTDILGV